LSKYGIHSNNFEFEIRFLEPKMTVSTKNFDRMKISEIENGVTLAENAALSKKVKVLNQCKLFFNASENS